MTEKFVHAHAVPICSGIEYSDQVTHFSLRLCSVVLSIPWRQTMGRFLFLAVLDALAAACYLTLYRLSARTVQMLVPMPE